MPPDPPERPGEYEPTLGMDEAATGKLEKGGRAKVDAEFSFSPGQVLGERYRVIKCLGRGGMGEVWQAYDLKLRVDVALKTLLMTVAGGEGGLELLRGEVRAAREVISPNVCRLFDIIEIDSQELVSMEFIDGKTLMGLLDERCPLEIQEAGEIGSQFLAGLEAIHQAGLVHRDIKPENIMITRSGRVVIMDFGLTAPSGTGEISGTPAYMPPEQGLGKATDARSDVFSAGMVLSEMLSAERGPEVSSRQTFWENVRKQPPVLPESPWSRILLKAVAAEPADRYESAAQLARKLEEIAVRVEGGEDKNPYPGLESFSEDAAEFFFGREAEVEALWKKLQESSLLGLIGASGAGKSSFVNAGLLPAKPEGWAHLKIKPGPAPFSALGRALLAALGEADALGNLTELEDPGSTLAALRSWRAIHPEVLLIVDQFEELFTQNSLEVQKHFADLLRRAAIEADIHVLLSMRDDFLIQCQRFSSLAPIFSDLTPLGPPIGTALRRALIQPARKCGYRFEDDSMIGEMLEEVAKERGALPLIAFTTARLWEQRDQDSGLLTRAAYDRMGGVEGALAQHAEAALETIGEGRKSIVRELFRNLVTAQGTRAVMEVEEVLSVFDEDREAAAEVVQSLIDARLLTTYEVRSAADEVSKRRVEIVHESLLAAWPRLVRWRTQDAEGAQLRDELRQAARLWEARNRSVDLLWTGTAFREFELWRERYPGRLTAVEESFASAMTSFEARRGRVRRIALATVVLLLVGVVGVISAMWRRAEAARAQSAAGQLLALARLQLERNPSSAIAYTLASLETADSPEARRFAVEALWRGPTAAVLKNGFAFDTEFSADGRWMVVKNSAGEVEWWSQDGERHGSVDVGFGPNYWPIGRPFGLGPESDLLITSLGPVGDTPSSIRFWSFPQGVLLRAVEIEELLYWDLEADGEGVLTVSESESEWLVHSWPLADGEPTLLGQVERQPDCRPQVDPVGRWFFCHDGETGPVSLRRLDAEGPTIVMKNEGEVVGHKSAFGTGIWFSSAGEHFATGDLTGEIRIWSLVDGTEPALVRVLDAHSAPVVDVAFDSPRRRFATASLDGTARIWDLDGPPEAESRVLRLAMTQAHGLAFHPDGDWLALSAQSVTMWPLSHSYASVLRSEPTKIFAVTFDPDGRWVASTSARGSLRLWPLDDSGGVSGRVLLEDPAGLLDLDVDREGRYLVAGRGTMGTRLVPLDGREPRMLEGFETQAWHVALSHDGRLAAAAGGLLDPKDAVIRIWDLETGEVQVLDPGDEQDLWHLQFTPQGRLVSGGRGAIRSWSLEEESFETLREAEEGRNLVFFLTLSPDGRLMASTASRRELRVQDLRNGDVWEVTSHGDRVQAMAIDSMATTLVTGDTVGSVRVGPISGETPHLLLGHGDVRVQDVAISPDGRLVASSGDDGTVRLWPMPEGQPFQTLEYDALLERLRALTNLRVLQDPEAQGGYRLDVDTFRGWEVAPTW